MAYSKPLIYGETTGQLDSDERYLEVKTSVDDIVIHVEDDESCIDLTIDVAEALALIRALTEAIEDVS